MEVVVATLAMVAEATAAAAMEAATAPVAADAAAASAAAMAAWCEAGVQGGHHSHGVTILFSKQMG